MMIPWRVWSVAAAISMALVVARPADGWAAGEYLYWKRAAYSLIADGQSVLKQECSTEDQRIAFKERAHDMYPLLQSVADGTINHGRQLGDAGYVYISTADAQEADEDGDKLLALTDQIALMPRCAEPPPVTSAPVTPAPPPPPAPQPIVQLEKPPVCFADAAAKAAFIKHWNDFATYLLSLIGTPGGSDAEQRQVNYRAVQRYVSNLQKIPLCAAGQEEHGMAPQPPGTGFYVGFNAGGASGSSRWLEPAPAISTNTFGVSGGLAGGTFGYQAQNGPLLLGVEVDIDGGGVSGRTSVNCGAPCRTSNTFLATVRGRAGIDLGPVTPFVTGGLAVGDVNAHVGAFPGAGTTQAGWAAGAGLQLQLGTLANGLPDGLAGKIEWLRVDLGSPHVCTPATCGGNANVKFQADVFRVGINVPLTILIPR